MNYFENHQSLLLEDFRYWENKKQYMDLMERFSNGKINGTQFETEFYKIWRVDRDKKYSLKEFFDKRNDVVLKKLEGFSALISELFTDCDIFQPDPALRDDYEISEEELRNRVKKTILKIQEYF